MKFWFHFFCFLILSVTKSGHAAELVEARQKRPNIILILADDLGYSDIGCYGGSIETPNLDRLASNGVRFTRFYNSARCCPSRASLLTGLHPHQTGLGAMVDNASQREGYQGEIDRRCLTLGEVLQRAGYRTYMTGKWHVTYSWDGSDKSNWPLQRGFDKYFGTIYGAGSYFDPRMLVHDNDTSSNSPDGFYYTDAISDTTLSFIETHERMHGDVPFFMYVAYTAPHWPLHAKESDILKYKGCFDTGWGELRQEKLKRMQSMGLIEDAWNLDDQVAAVSQWSSVENKSWESKRMEVYAAMVDCMDQGIGRILYGLEESGELENTIVIFLSDNGACAETWPADNPWAANFGPEFTRDGKRLDYSNNGSTDPGPPETYHSYGRGWAHLSNTPFKGYKSGTYEGGISTPMIISWPGNIEDQGAFRRQTGGIIDIMPTLLDVAEATYPELYQGYAVIPMEGLSLVGTIKENNPIDRSSYYLEHIGRRSLIDSSGYKVVKFNNKPWELYQLEEDRAETVNKSELMPEKTKELADRWERWAWRAYVLPKPK